MTGNAMVTLSGALVAAAHALRVLVLRMMCMQLSDAHLQLLARNGLQPGKRPTALILSLPVCGTSVGWSAWS